MIREAEVFLLADTALVETVARVDDWDSVVPPVFDMPGADRPATVRAMVAHLAYDEGRVPAMLAGRAMDEIGRDRFDDAGDDPRATLSGSTAPRCRCPPTRRGRPGTGP